MQGLHHPGKLILSSACVAIALIYPTFVLADELPVTEFDPAFLATSSEEQIDLSRFSHGGSALPGTYRTRIFLNSEMVLLQDVTFITGKNQRVVPCLTRELLAQLPLDETKVPESAIAALTEQCIDIKDLIPEAQLRFDSAEQMLTVETPQIYVSHIPRGTVPPELWDSGVPAVLFNYNTNVYSSESRGYHYRSMYASLNSGVNIGSWYFRHNGTWNWTKDQGAHYRSINTWVQRDIPAIKGRVLLGQSNTSGRLFDTLPFTGVKVDSDERMEPQSRRGYAPEIRGVARTNAQVTIKQNGNLLYETTVSPGSFVINDLYPTGYGGDLDVTVREADGSEQSFLVPYSSVTELLRPGASRYEFVAGELHTGYLSNEPTLVQGSWQYGLNNRVTLYGGIQGAEFFWAGQGGGAVATPFGAISIDITHAQAKPGGSAEKNRDSSGQSYRISYSKYIPETRSNFSLAAYRFSTSGYMDFLTASQVREAIRHNEDSNTIRRAKQRFTLMASQGLPENWGQFYVSTSLQNYWNTSGTDKQYQVGYSNYWNRITYGISAGRTYNLNGRAEDTVTLNFTFPLGQSHYAPQSRLSYTRNSEGRHSWLATVSGTAGDDNRFGYGITGSTANKGYGSSGAISGQYRSPYTSLNASYSRGSNYSSTSGGLTGTVVGHSGGLTLSPYQGDTFALVEAKGAEGAKVSGYGGVYLDGNGYALVPYLNPYQFNEIAIDLKGTGRGVELENTSQKVSPRDNAVVKLSYNARRGRPLLINATHQGSPLPFGTEVKDASGKVAGYVGQGGQVYARVEQDSGVLQAHWGKDADQQCHISYQLPAVSGKRKETTLQEFAADCRQE